MMHLGSRRHDPKGAESIIQELLIHVFVQIANEKICTNVELFLVGGRLDRERCQ
jgi:hypothetical protein